MDSASGVGMQGLGAELGVELETHWECLAVE